VATDPGDAFDLERLLASAQRIARPGWDPSAPDPRIVDAEAREEQTRTFATELFAIHPTYVHEAEEEIVFLADAFLSPIPEASCDVPGYRSWVCDQDWGRPSARSRPPGPPASTSGSTSPPTSTSIDTRRASCCAREGRDLAGGCAARTS